MATAERYDYVVVGGGTAGSVLAARLSQDPEVRVILLEAGPSDGPEAMDSPSPAVARSLWGSAVDWCYSTVPQPGAGDAVLDWPRGKVLGGSSSINAMMHVRGHPSSYDAWAAQGATGWDYASLLPYLRRSEHTEGRDPRLRGTTGPMCIEEGPPPGPLAQATYLAAAEAGHARLADGNGAQAEGVCWNETTVAAGRHQSAADAYVRPALGRPNLTVLTEARAERLLLDGLRCRGVEYTATDGVQAVHTEREVVLAAGVIGSPQLLMLSGIGPAAHLRDVAIEVTADLPGVGQNLHDHPLSWVSYAAARSPRNGFFRQARVLARSDAGTDPDLLISFSPAALLPRWAGARPDGYSIFFCLASPASRGSLRLRSADWALPPLIDPGYLTDERDVERMVTGLRMARDIGAADALTPWRAAEFLPGPDTCDDGACRAYIRDTMTSFFHPVGTCRAGTDELAVVDPLLRVRGIDGLRVADASIMPSVVSAPTNATVLAIAERAASIITGDLGG
jgi:choline dehydrogenase